MRLFLGFDIPAEIKHQIHEFLLPIQKTPKGWENPHDYHQTVLFIGEASEDEKKIIEDRMENFTFKPFILTPGRFEFFNRRIMFLAFKSCPELIELKFKVDAVFPEWVKPHSK